MKTLIYSVFILLLAPCNSTKKATSTTPVNDHSKLSITFERTPCFGQCPTYKLSINGATKIATFKGEEHTEKIGTYTKTVTDDELTQLVKAFEVAGFNSLNDAYMGNISDFPTQITSYSNNGKTKTVKNRSDAPAALRTLEKTLADFAENTEGWTKSETADH